MKKFYSVICTFFAAIQSTVFWYILIVYLMRIDEFSDIRMHIGFWAVSFIVLLIISLIDKFVRGFEIGEIFVDALLSPFRFIAQFITMILCFQEKVNIEREGYTDYSLWSRFVFILCSVNPLDPDGTKKTQYYVPPRTYSKPRYSSNSSYSSSQSQKPSAPKRMLGAADVLNHAQRVAKGCCNFVWENGNRVEIDYSARMSGNTVYFKISLRRTLRANFRSLDDKESFENSLAYQISSDQKKIRDMMHSWCDKYTFDNNYYIDFERGSWNIN